MDKADRIIVDRADRIIEEAKALWLELFGEQPGPDVDERQMLDILLQRIDVKSYTRLAPASRSRNLTFPE